MSDFFDLLRYLLFLPAWLVYLAILAAPGTAVCLLWWKTQRETRDVEQETAADDDEVPVSSEEQDIAGAAEEHNEMNASFHMRDSEVLRRRAGIAGGLIAGWLTFLAVYGFYKYLCST